MALELRSSFAFGRFPLPSLAERGVRVVERDRACLVLIRGRGTLPELPHGPQRVQVGRMSLAGVGPRTWLAIGDGASSELVTALHLALGETAVIVDQSDGWSVLRITGPRARESLAKLFAVDLHNRAFTQHDFAVTVGAQVDAMLWRIEDAEDGEPVFEIAVPRSYAGSFWHALSESVR